MRLYGNDDKLVLDNKIDTGSATSRTSEIKLLPTLDRLAAGGMIDSAFAAGFAA
ncbi:hypothetical protein GCM10010869_04860 [Mesorhizobium tianshanense]|nr:hypothetical protein GCM10010869_04860 [Mesorhizobium tianshanense]